MCGITLLKKCESIGLQKPRAKDCDGLDGCDGEEMKHWGEQIEWGTLSRWSRRQLDSEAATRQEGTCDGNRRLQHREGAFQGVEGGVHLKERSFVII